MVINGEMRKSHVHDAFKQASCNGLTELLPGKLEFEQAVRFGQNTPKEIQIAGNRLDIRGVTLRGTTLNGMEKKAATSYGYYGYIQLLLQIRVGKGRFLPRTLADAHGQNPKATRGLTLPLPLPKTFSTWPLQSRKVFRIFTSNVNESY